MAIGTVTVRLAHADMAEDVEHALVGGNALRNSAAPSAVKCERAAALAAARTVRDEEFRGLLLFLRRLLGRLGLHRLVLLGLVHLRRASMVRYHGSAVLLGGAGIGVGE